VVVVLDELTMTIAVVVAAAWEVAAAAVEVEAALEDDPIRVEEYAAPHIPCKIDDADCPSVVYIPKKTPLAPDTRKIS
jgi:hypothetical protein